MENLTVVTKHNCLQIQRKFQCNTNRLELLRLLNYRLSFLFILPFFYLQETRILDQLKQMSKVLSITKYLVLDNSLTSCLIPTLQTSAAEQKSCFVVQPLGKNNMILSLTSLEFRKSVSSNPTDSPGATPACNSGSNCASLCALDFRYCEAGLFFQMNQFLRLQTKPKFSTTGTHRTLSMVTVN